MRLFSLIVLLALTACSKTPVVQSGPDANINEQGLTQVDHTAFDKTYVAPDANIKSYRQFVFAPLDLSEVDVVNPKIHNMQESDWVFTEKDEKQFADAYAQAVEKQFTKNDTFSLVTKAGPGVALVKSKITRFAPTAPKYDSIDRGVRSEFYTKTSGDLTIVTEIVDSSTGKLLANMEDNRDMGNDMTFHDNNVATFAMDLRNAFYGWTRAFVDQLETIQ